MSTEPVTAVEGYREQHRWRLRIGVIILALLMVIGLVVIVGSLIVAKKLSGSATPYYSADLDHFKYGSIGSEPHSGVPLKIWQALPAMFPDEFEGRNDYSAFGFLYENDQSGKQKELPIGVSLRQVYGVDVVWLNCATCHTGTWRGSPGDVRHIVAGMPSNNLDFNRFVGLFIKLAGDERLDPAQLFPILDERDESLGWFEKLVWQAGVLPRFREGLIRIRARLEPLIARQYDWGPGRVDTFNPYKLLQFDMPASSLANSEIRGVSDFPAIFDQGPREGMELHWDGNNNSLAERNLSAAIGAGVTIDSVDHAAIERVAAWLQQLPPPPSPNQPEATAVSAGHTIYMAQCASCHGSKEQGGYSFEGHWLGKVTPIAEIQTDPGRLESYTEALRDLQLTKMFAGTPYHFTAFRKTNGYANQPLDGLWLRGPYLHNGSVPTLADLLNEPQARPKAFLRGHGQDVIDPLRGGFITETCDPAKPGDPDAFCFDTTLPGNGNGGHLYGVNLSAEDKGNLLAYLLTF